MEVPTTDNAASSQDAVRRKSSYELMVAQDNTQYLAALQKEKQEWSELLSQRSKALRLEKKELDRPGTLTYDDIKSGLTDEERDFLAASPDYRALLKSARDAKNAVEIAAEEKRECLLRTYHVVEKIQEQVNQDVRAIIDLPDPVLE